MDQDFPINKNIQFWNKHYLLQYLDIDRSQFMRINIFETNSIHLIFIPPNFLRYFN
jgi:hypothetical protein